MVQSIIVPEDVVHHNLLTTRASALFSESKLCKDRSNALNVEVVEFGLEHEVLL